MNSNLALNYDDTNHTQELRIVDKPTEWLTIKDAAEIMEVAPSNVRYLCINKRIECRKFGNVWQVSRQDAEDYKRSKRNPEWLHPDND